MAVPDTIIGDLKACPTPNDQWRYAYELIVGAAASLLCAAPHYAGTSHYGHKEQYQSGKLLPDLLEEAYKHTTSSGQPLNLYYNGLRDWTAGYYFNSGIVRIACAYEYTFSTALERNPYEFLALKKGVLDSLKLRQPPPAIKMQLEVFESLSSKEQLNREVDAAIDNLAKQVSWSAEEQVDETFKMLRSKDNDFFKASVFFVWCDYNWFKHRPMGYDDSSPPRKNPCVQFSLALRAYRGVCELYSWCRNL